MHWRRVAGLGSVGAVLVIPLAVMGLPLVVRAFFHGVVLITNGCIWLAMAISAGMSWSSVLATIVRAAGEALTAPMVSVVLAALLAVGVAAFYGLQRVLGAEEGKSQE